MDGLILLCVNIESTCCKNLLGDGIHDARTAVCSVVVASITNHKLLILAVWFGCKRGLREMTVSVVQFLSLHLERGRLEMAAPSTSDFKTRLLIDDHLALCLRQRKPRRYLLFRS